MGPRLVAVAATARQAVEVTDHGVEGEGTAPLRVDLADPCAADAPHLRRVIKDLKVHMTEGVRPRPLACTPPVSMVPGGHPLVLRQPLAT